VRRHKRSGRGNGDRPPLFARSSLFFFDRPRLTLALGLIIFTLGIASYTTFLKREGFPDVSIGYSFIDGAYLVDDPAKVDRDIAVPVSEVVAKLDEVKFVDSKSGANFFNIIVQFKDGTDSTAGSAAVEEAVRTANVLPKEAMAEFKPLSPEINERGDDMLVAFYAPDGNVSIEQLAEKGKKAAAFIKDDPQAELVTLAELIDPFVRGTNPNNGQAEISQKTFDRFGFAQDGSNKFYESVEIGVQGAKGFDVLELDDQVRASIEKLNQSSDFEGFTAAVSYSNAPSINEQIDTLQRALLEGLLAVLVVSAILIALRASLITVASMVLVIMTTLTVLWGIGYSLNTITLFSLILCLALIVDDTVIMVEAVDAERRRSKLARQSVERATRKIARVMVAATLTATIGFAPLIFVGGILGGFIRAIPITVISALLVSLVVSLIFIPVFARYLLLRPSQLNIGLKRESAAHHLERFIAGFLARPIKWMRPSRKRQIGLGLGAVLVGIAFIFGGLAMFSKVPFNIFAPSKDSNQLLAQLSFDSGQDINQVQAVADRADQIIADKMGADLNQASYFNTGTQQMASLYIDLVHYKERDIKAPQLADQLEAALANLEGATVKVGTVDVGPTAAVFTVRIETTETDKAVKLAEDMRRYLEEVELKRLDGSTAHLKAVTISSTDLLERRDGKAYLRVQAGEFDGTDTSTLVTLSEQAVTKEYTAQKLVGFGLPSDVIKFDIGAEEDFQNSFNTMLIAFPILLVAIYILLVLQFRSLLQPLLIFMAIPFSLVGITGGLWLTDNAFSFFTMLGFFALLGLSIKNTILLTDYANQAQRAGQHPIEAIATSLQERYRPLAATSFAAIFALVPLYLSDPFWEGLTITLMFGLLASTFLVMTVFPYFYLGAEFLRLHIRRRTFLEWLGLAIIFSGPLVLAGQPALIPLGILAAIIGVVVLKKAWGRA
jgi:multidrug efflux pump subunit AcrB